MHDAPELLPLLRHRASPAGSGLAPWQALALVGARIAAGLRADIAAGVAVADGMAPGRDAGAQTSAAEASWARILRFLDRQADRARSEAPPPMPQALDALGQSLSLSDDERTLLLLAALPEAHEGYGAALAALHPRGESRATWGLFAWLTAAGDASREAALRLHRSSRLLLLGLVQLSGDVPLPERSLRLADGLWPALNGLPVWPDGLSPLPASPWLDGLDGWLDSAATRHALALLRASTLPVPASLARPAHTRPPWGDDNAGALPAAVLLRGLQPAALRLRAQQLAAATGGLVFEWDAARDASQLSALLAQLLVLAAPPALLVDAALPPAHWALLDACPMPLVLAGAPAGQAARSARALCTLDAPPLGSAALAGLWARALPALAPHAAALTARYPVGPEALHRLQADLAPWLSNGSVPPLPVVVAALKARMARADESFARRVQPQAGWPDLVLPTDRLAPLKAAVERMSWQQRVLDDWGFAHPGSATAGPVDGGAARGPRGLRLLFSGLPGTGKTLAAEVVAHALHADLLVIDLARLVSKWIGETEKNLAAAFDQAEGTGAVLFFDEADALFGKRTEVGDAHDRYANIESAYLLARLERFDGVAILATNLRGNLDRAYLRRFEVAVDFAEPGPAERAAIWRRQFPPAAPLAADVDFDALAALHALPGALIRNAAVGAAFAAAADGGAITRHHIECALQQEYGKSGRVNPR